jgi:energy-coupling factor transporter ATP-binding protein EcfA2
MSEFKEAPAAVTTSDDPNTITQTQDAKYKVRDAYAWATKLAAEQGEDEYEFTPETKALLERLNSQRGQLIAVIGLQGSGKTALRQALQLELQATNDEKQEGAQRTILTLKWVGDSKEHIIETFDVLNEADTGYVSMILGELIQKYKVKASKHLRDVGISHEDNIIASQISQAADIEEDLLPEYFENEIHRKEHLDTYEERRRDLLTKIGRHLTKMERLLPKQRREAIRKRRLEWVLYSSGTLLIDLPDYDRHNIGEMSRHLTSLQYWWETVFANKEPGIYGQEVNLVIFFQKELFHGHFFMGKLDPVELKPFTAAQLAEYYQDHFGIYPFTEAALLELGALSRGIFRRFKKYVRRCLENFGMRWIPAEHSSEPLVHLGPDGKPDANIIDTQQVNDWIGLNEVIKDMELELMTIFPKERENRILTVKVLAYLRAHGPTTQSEITQEIFDDAAMKASRVLDRIESWGYIKRERVGKEKIVKLEEWR